MIGILRRTGVNIVVSRSFSCSFSFYRLTREDIESLILDGLEVEELQIEDISQGCGTMFRLSVTSEEFDGKTKIQQHKIIHKLLGEEMKKLHGLTIETKVPDTEKDDDL